MAMRAASLPAGVWIRTHQAGLVWGVAVLVALVGAALRFEALISKYGPIDHPRWARHADLQARRFITPVRPGAFAWAREANPYVGGDPYSYLELARSQPGFYAADVREPMFPYLTGAWLGALDQQDVAVSFASMTGSTLLVPATFLVGAEALSPAVGLLAALFLAVERDVIGWGVEGWRDDLFALFVICSTWALLRLAKSPRVDRAVVAGIVAGAACLTRLTAVSFLVPGFIATAAWLLVRRGWRAATLVLLAGAIAIALVAPYLVNCARAFGDPFYAVNYHTRFYEARSGLAPEATSAADYVASRVSRRPLWAAATALTGLTTYPFLNKWKGFSQWAPGLGALLAAATVVGLVLALRSWPGRLVLLVLVTSLVPYCLTWPIRGGAEWRFTLHAYPIYLVAGALAVETAVRWVRDPARARRVFSGLLRRTRSPWVWAGAVVAVAAVWAGGQVLPYLIVRESGLAGEPVVITAAEGGLLFGGGWTRPHATAAFTVRYIREPRAQLRVPLPPAREYRWKLCADPLQVAPDDGHLIGFRVNGTLAATIHERRAPGADGCYDLAVPHGATRIGLNRIEFRSTNLVPADQLGRRAPGLPARDRAALRFWRLEVIPGR